MKKLICLCLLLTSFYIVNSSELSKKRISLFIDIGKKSCDCCECGFCGMGITVTWNQENIPLAGEKKAYGYVEDINGTLVMTLFVDSMTEKTINTYFSNHQFIMGEDFTIPYEICKELGIKSYTLKKGNYKVIQQDRKFIISF
jgi:hypothetical protein